MNRFEIEILLKRPIADVFEYVTWGEHLPIWNSSFLEVRRISKDFPGVGTLYLVLRELPQGDVENTLEVIEYEQDSKLTVKTITGPAPFVYRYRFSPKGESTKLSIQAEVEEQELPPRTSSSPTSRSAKHRLKENLRALKTLLEAGA